MAVETEGPGDLMLWSDSGASYGVDQITFKGDSQLPTVWSQDPSGQYLDTVSEVRVRFSESLDEDTVLLDNFLINGATANSVTLSEADEVLIGLASPVLGSLSVWDVTVSKEVRDLAGNRLAGTWSSAAESYVGYFGDYIPSVDALNSCEVSPASFRPDGDDGLADEADSTLLSMQSTSAPAWWVITISDADSNWVRREFVGASLASSDWVWNGRGENGVVVDKGKYQIQVQGMDSSGNLSSACSSQVEVLHDFEIGE
jgi:hypothetical protein